MDLIELKNFYFSFFKPPLKNILLDILKEQAHYLIDNCNEFQLLEKNVNLQIDDETDFVKVCDLFQRKNWTPASSLYNTYNIRGININNCNFKDVFFALERNLTLSRGVIDIINNSDNKGSYNLFKERLLTFPQIASELRAQRNRAEHSPDIVSEGTYNVLIGNLKLLIENAHETNKIKNALDKLDNKIDEFEKGLFKSKSGFTTNKIENKEEKNSNTNISTENNIKNYTFEKKFLEETAVIKTTLDEQNKNIEKILLSLKDEKEIKKTDESSKEKKEIIQNDQDEEVISSKFDIHDKDNRITKKHAFLILSVLRDKIKKTVIKKDDNFKLVDDAETILERNPEKNLSLINDTENICQINILREIIYENNPKSLEDWKNIVTGTSDNFYKENTIVINFQLEHFWKDIENVLHRIEK